MFNRKQSPITTSICGLLLLGFATCQLTTSAQNVTFNSSYTLSPSQITAAKINNTVAEALDIALNFERSNWATGSVQDDDFYHLPPNASKAVPGDVLKIQYNANASFYTLPPATALSRIMYMTEHVNGSVVPTTAYIMWPYRPRLTHKNSFPVVAWGHGASGSGAECAPSHVRNLWYQYNAPYPLALSGYVVVAPDYAGLGINQTADGTPIYQQFLDGRRHADDLFYAVQAAQTAFPQLSCEFVVMGHSQGGTAAWGAAVRQAIKPVAGYLGAVAATPWVDLPSTLNLPFASLHGAQPPSEAAIIAMSPWFPLALKGRYPSFQLSEILTDWGIRYHNLVEDIGGCNSASSVLLAANSSTLQPDYNQGYHLQAYANQTKLAGERIAGPMLVVHGVSDPLANVTVTHLSVNRTCEAFPTSQIELYTYEGVEHVPVLYASQTLWLDWIAERFVEVGKNKTTTSGGCKRSALTSLSRPLEDFPLGGINYILEYATAGYLTV